MSSDVTDLPIVSMAKFTDAVDDADEKTVKESIALGLHVLNSPGLLYTPILQSQKKPDKKQEYLNILKMLIDAKANVHCRHYKGLTPLAVAIDNQNIDMAIALADAMTNFESPHNIYPTELQQAFDANLHQVARRIVQRFEMIEKTEPQKNGVHHEILIQILGHTIVKNNEEEFNYYLELLRKDPTFGINISYIDNKTFLFFALEHGTKNMVQALLDAGADITVKTSKEEDVFTFILNNYNRPTTISSRNYIYLHCLLLHAKDKLNSPKVYTMLSNTPFIKDSFPPNDKENPQKLTKTFEQIIDFRIKFLEMCISLWHKDNKSFKDSFDTIEQYLPYINQKAIIRSISEFVLIAVVHDNVSAIKLLEKYFVIQGRPVNDTEEIIDHEKNFYGNYLKNWISATHYSINVLKYFLDNPNFQVEMRYNICQMLEDAVICGKLEAVKLILEHPTFNYAKKTHFGYDIYQYLLKKSIIHKQNEIFHYLLSFSFELDYFLPPLFPSNQGNYKEPPQNELYLKPYRTIVTPTTPLEDAYYSGASKIQAELEDYYFLNHELSLIDVESAAYRALQRNDETAFKYFINLIKKTSAFNPNESFVARIKVNAKRVILSWVNEAMKYNHAPIIQFLKDEGGFFLDQDFLKAYHEMIGDKNKETENQFHLKEIALKLLSLLPYPITEYNSQGDLLLKSLECFKKEKEFDSIIKFKKTSHKKLIIISKQTKAEIVEQALKLSPGKISLDALRSIIWQNLSIVKEYEIHLEQEQQKRKEELQKEMEKRKAKTEKEYLSSLAQEVLSGINNLKDDIHIFDKEFWTNISRSTDILNIIKTCDSSLLNYSFNFNKKDPTRNNNAIELRYETNTKRRKELNKIETEAYTQYIPLIEIATLLIQNQEKIIKQITDELNNIQQEEVPPKTEDIKALRDKKSSLDETETAATNFKKTPANSDHFKILCQGFLKKLEDIKSLRESIFKHFEGFKPIEFGILNQQSEIVEKRGPRLSSQEAQDRAAQHQAKLKNAAILMEKKGEEEAQKLEIAKAKEAAAKALFEKLQQDAIKANALLERARERARLNKERIEREKKEKTEKAKASPSSNGDSSKKTNGSAQGLRTHEQNRAYYRKPKPHTLGQYLIVRLKAEDSLRDLKMLLENPPTADSAKDVQGQTIHLESSPKADSTKNFQPMYQDALLLTCAELMETLKSGSSGLFPEDKARKCRNVIYHGHTFYDKLDQKAIYDMATSIYQHLRRCQEKSFKTPDDEDTSLKTIISTGLFKEILDSEVPEKNLKMCLKKIDSRTKAIEKIEQLKKTKETKEISETLLNVVKQKSSDFNIAVRDCYFVFYRDHFIDHEERAQIIRLCKPYHQDAIDIRHNQRKTAAPAKQAAPATPPPKDASDSPSASGFAAGDSKSDRDFKEPKERKESLDPALRASKAIHQDYSAQEYGSPMLYQATAYVEALAPATDSCSSVYSEGRDEGKNAEDNPKFHKDIPRADRGDTKRK